MDDLRDCSTLENALRELPFVEEIGISEGYPGKSNEVLKATQGGSIVYGMIRCDSTAFSLYGFKRLTNNVSSVLNTLWMSQGSLTATGLDPESEEFMLNLPTTRNSTIFGGILEDYAVFDVLKDASDAIGFIQVFGTDGFVPFMSSGGGLLMKTTGDHFNNRKVIEDTYRNYTIERNGIYTEPYESGYIRDLLCSTLDEVENNRKLMELFMFLSILLSFMGLVAMSTYFSSENISDIAIRKIYGSTVKDETVGNIWKYMKVVLVSAVVAVPVAVLACGRYLEGFVYRIDNLWWVYVLAVCIALLISLAAISVQTLRAARTNPAEVLKKE